MKRLGIIAQDINSGIGVQTQEYARWLKPNKVLITDLTSFHEAAGKNVKRYPERFSKFDTRVTEGVPNLQDLEWLLKDIDVILIVETPINHNLYSMARERGVKTCLAYNYELLDKLHSEHAHLPMADELWAPTMWHYLEMQQKAKEWGCKWRYMPVPVNRELLPFKPSSKARVFLHIAGHPTFMDRNGTDIVLTAIPLVKNKNVQFLIRSQRELPEIDDPRVVLIRGEVRNYYEAHSRGDVLLLPRRYGGLTLQLNEALSRGMVPIMPDISPQNGFLREEWLVPAHFHSKAVTRPEIDVYDIGPLDLAKKIDHYSGLSDFTFSHWSLAADKIAQDLDWEYLLPLYREALDE